MYMVPVYSPMHMFQNEQIFNCLASPIVDYQHLNAVIIGSLDFIPARGNIVYSGGAYPVDEERSSRAAMEGGGGAQRSHLCANEPKKTRAFSEQRQHFACIYFTVGSDNI